MEQTWMFDRCLKAEGMMIPAITIRSIPKNLKGLKIIIIMKKGMFGHGFNKNGGEKQ